MQSRTLSGSGFRWRLTLTDQFFYFFIRKIIHLTKQLCEPVRVRLLGLSNRIYLCRKARDGGCFKHSAQGNVCRTSVPYSVDQLRCQQ